MIPDYYNVSLRLEGLDPSELTCLDLGCGAYNSDVAKQVLDFPWKKLTSVDGYALDLEAAALKPSQAKEWTRILGDVRTIDVPAHDVVLSFDVLEHLPKKDGEEWLKGLDKLAKKRIVLFFPLEPAGFHRSWTSDDNKLQEHVSHWGSHELLAFGFKTHEITDVHSEPNGDGSYIHFGACWAVKDL